MSTPHHFSPPPDPSPYLPSSYDLIRHGHSDLVQAVAFNFYGDRCATGSVDGKIRVFNRHRDGLWRACDAWSAHGGEILELQWLPPTISPNLLASLGIEGRFKLWSEDPSAAPGRRFSARGGPGGGGGEKGLLVPGGATGKEGNPKAAFETRNSRSPYRSFSMKYMEESRHTYLALLAADGVMQVYENEAPEDLADYSLMDELSVGSKPARGEETAFRVRFDPNGEVCYTALKAGVPVDALGLVVAAMDTVRIYRTRDVVGQSLGVVTAGRQFYLAVEVGVHKGLVRDVAWAGGNIRGYDIIATACQDGFVRVFKLTTPVEKGEGEERERMVGWGVGEVKKHGRRSIGGGDGGEEGGGARGKGVEGPQPKSGLKAGLDQLKTGGEKRAPPAQIKHVVTEISRLDIHRTPVWRVGFDDDGHILGSVGDEGRLICYRQMPDGTWAKSSENSVIRMKMAAPTA